MPSPLSGTRCSDENLISDAFDAILLHSVQMMCDNIQDCVSAQLRNHNAAMLNKLPVTCARLRATARGDRRYSAVMFYERTRLGAANSGHFLEGLAPGLALFSGATPVELLDADLRKLKLRDVVSDRIKTVTNLESLKNNEDRFQKLVREYTLTDAAPGLPGRVHIFIARMRAICQGLQRVKPESHLKQCKNCECNRLFYHGASNETSGPAPAPAPAVDPERQTYWDLAAGGPEVADEQGEFCTWSCCMQWRWQLHQALPEGSDAVMVADYQCRKDGRSRVPEALRRCGKRNELAGRHLRTIQKEQRIFPSLAPDELKKQRRRRVRMLNVDLGLLYVASILADSKGLSTNKVLAGASEGWRSRPMFYARALKEVGKLYDRHHTGGNVVANMLIHEPFLTKLKEKASRIF